MGWLLPRAARVVGGLLVTGILFAAFASQVAGASGPATPAAVVHPSAFALGYDGISPAAISLNWTASTASEFINYTIFRATDASGICGTWTYVTAEGTEATTTVDVAGLAPGGSYCWNVTAYSTSLLGLGGTTATPSTILQATQPPVANLTSPVVTSASIQLNWTNNATYGGGIAFGHYAVEEVNGSATSTVANLTVVTENSTTVGGLMAGSSYSFYIDTYDCAPGCAPSGYSTTQSNVVTAGTATPVVASVSASRTTTDVGLTNGFTCTPAGGAPPYTFAWNFTNGSTYLPGPGTTSWSYAHPATYEVTCQVTDHTPRKVTTTPLAIVVDPAPRVVASVSAHNVTVGDSVTFRCTGSRGDAPLSVRWALGDGGTLTNGVGSDYANGTASYSSAGTYVAKCTVTDAVGARAVTARVVSVSAAPAFAWVTPPVVLASAIAVGAVLALAVAAYRRRADAADRSSAMSRWLPPTGPAATVHGAKICPKCGASNVPLRRSCQACGTPLPRHPGP
jgi:hypothetical protein